MSSLRDQVEALVLKHYLSAAVTVENCIDKEKPYQIWQLAGLHLPKNMLFHNPTDLKKHLTCMVKQSKCGGLKAVVDLGHCRQISTILTKNG